MEIKTKDEILERVYRRFKMLGLSAREHNSERTPGRPWVW